MATPSGKVPIAETAAAGLKFFTENWRRILPACALMGLAYGAHYGVSGAGNKVASDATLAAIAILSIVIGAHFYRLALRTEAVGFLDIRLGATELRFAASSAISASVILGIMLAASMLLIPSIIGAANKGGISLQAAGASPATMQALIMNSGTAPIILICAMAVVVWLVLRLSLSTAATIDQNKIMCLSTIKWAKGNIWRMFAASLLLLVPLGIVALVFPALIQLALKFDASSAPQLPTAELPPMLFLIWAVQLFSTPMSAAGPTTAMFDQSLFVLGAASGFFWCLVIVAPSVGLMTYLYKGLRPPPQ